MTDFFHHNFLHLLRAKSINEFCNTCDVSSFGNSERQDVDHQTMPSSGVAAQLLMYSKD
jgi:hypothetical protein